MTAILNGHKGSWKPTHSDQEAAALLTYIKRVEENPFYIEVRKHIELMIPKMTLRVAYELKKIWGENAWFFLEKWQKIDAGIYVSALVATKQLPLDEVLWAHEYPKKYIRQ